MTIITNEQLEQEYQNLEKLLKRKIYKISTENNIPVEDIKQTIKMSLIELFEQFREERNVKKHNYLLKYIDYNLLNLIKKEGKYCNLKRHGNEILVKIHSMLEEDKDIKNIPTYKGKIQKISNNLHIGVKTIKQYLNPPFDTYITNSHAENNIKEVFEKINSKQIKKIIINELGSKNGKIFIHAVYNGIDNKVIAKIYKVPVHTIDYSIKKSKNILKKSSIIKHILGVKNV